MTWAVIVIVGLIGLVGLVALVGLLLPKGHRASKTRVLPAPPAAIHKAITDVARYQDWRADVKAIEILPDDGRGLRFREIGRHGSIAMRFEINEPHRIVGRIDDPSLPFGGTWTYDLKPLGTGTELTITEDGEVYNPIFRVMSRMTSQTATMEAFLTALEKTLEPVSST